MRGTSSVRRGSSSGRGPAADNPGRPSCRPKPEHLPVAVGSSVSSVRLGLLAVIFLVDVILIWSFPDGPAFLQTLNAIVWIVWACFAVDYVARLLLSVEKVRFVRTQMDLLIVLLPMLRLLRVSLCCVTASQVREHGEDRRVDPEHRDCGCVSAALM